GLHFSGARSWEDAMGIYKKEAWAATHPMFVATTGRLKRELYEEPPEVVMRTLMRWTLSDPLYQETFLRVLGRGCPPEEMTAGRLMGGAMLRGIARDIRTVLGRRPGRN